MIFFTKHETVCLFVLLLFCAHTLKYLFLECLRYFWTSARDEIFCFALLKPVSTVRGIDVRKVILPQARLAGWTANLRLGNWNVWDDENWIDGSRRWIHVSRSMFMELPGVSLRCQKSTFTSTLNCTNFPNFQTNQESERSLSSDARNQQEKKKTLLNN